MGTTASTWSHDCEQYRPCCAAEYCFKVCLSAVVPRLSCLSAAQPLLVAAEHVQGRAAKRRGQKSLVPLHMTGHAQSSFKQVSEHLSQTFEQHSRQRRPCCKFKTDRPKKSLALGYRAYLAAESQEKHPTCASKVSSRSRSAFSRAASGPPGRMPAATCPPTPAGPALPPFCPARWPA